MSSASSETAAGMSPRSRAANQASATARGDITSTTTGASFQEKPHPPAPSPLRWRGGADVDPSPLSPAVGRGRGWGCFSLQVFGDDRVEAALGDGRDGQDGVD